MSEAGTDGPLVIVAGVDGSDSSMRAAFYAAGLARRQGARLTVVYIQAVGATLNPMADALAAQTGRDIADDLARQIREAAHDTAAGQLTDVDLIVEPGDPCRSLVNVADRLKADTVVIGASQQAGHRLLGSIAVRLVKTARWPVTVVP